jgi:hypothetical protein
MQDFRFSPLGTAYLAMLFVPNLLWAGRRSRRANPGEPKENALLLTLERVGQAGTTIAALVLPANQTPGPVRLTCLAVSLLAMALYELSWLRYFGGAETTVNLYRSLGPIPMPLATLPVLGFILLALYEVHPYLLAGVLILGVGHIGVHGQHARQRR